MNLITGEETGQVYLLDHIAGPKVRGTLDVVGTGVNGDRNPTFAYDGECTFRGREAAGEHVRVDSLRHQSDTPEALARRDARDRLDASVSSEVVQARKPRSLVRHRIDARRRVGVLGGIMSDLERRPGQSWWHPDVSTSELKQMLEANKGASSA